MAEYQLSLPAEKDFKDIYKYTLKTWGETQADKYMSEMASAFRRLLLPPRGKMHGKLRNGLRSKRQGKHVIYFLESGDEAIILRILHEKMDPIRHLTEKK